MKNDIKKLVESIKYNFKNEDLLELALTHRSYVNESLQTVKKDNEKLEFLGDSVLNLITTEYIVNTFENLNEGELSKIKSQIISETVFAAISKDLCIGEYLYLSKGENMSGGRNRNSILGDAFEALIGAIFLDSDYYTTRDIALKLLIPKINNLSKIDGVGDYKTKLQEYVQSIYKTTPEYELIESVGPDHDKSFKVKVSINGKVLAYGLAKSKKNAEKQAAKKAMIELGEKW